MKAILQLVRWQNLLFIVFIMWLMEKMVALPVLGVSYYEEQLPTYILCLLIMGVVFVAAGGYAINDYFDVRIDAINRPEKQIVTRSISKPTAMLCHQVMTVIGVLSGLAVAIMVRSWSLGLIFVFTPGLLWFYSSSYKRQFIGLSKPRFQEFDNVFRVELFRVNPITDQATNQDLERLDQVEDENVLSEKEIEILNLVRMQPSITQKEMANALDWNLASVKYYITKLKEKNYLKRQGSSQKGKWVILTKRD